jgi:hypothetical protein
MAIHKQYREARIKMIHNSPWQDEHGDVIQHQDQDKVQPKVQQVTNPTLQDKYCSLQEDMTCNAKHMPDGNP